MHYQPKEGHQPIICRFLPKTKMEMKNLRPGASKILLHRSVTGCYMVKEQKPMKHNLTESIKVTTRSAQGHNKVSIRPTQGHDKVSIKSTQDHDNVRTRSTQDHDKVNTMSQQGQHKVMTRSTQGHDKSAQGQHKVSTRS